VTNYPHIRRQARRTTSRRSSAKGKSSSPGLWLLTGIFLGIVGVITGYQFLTGKWSIDQLRSRSSKTQVRRLNTHYAQSHTHPNQNQPAKTAHPEKSKLIAQKKPSTQRFEFYQLLPGMEVTIPDPEAKKAPRLERLDHLPPSQRFGPCEHK